MDTIPGSNIGYMYYQVHVDLSQIDHKLKINHQLRGPDCSMNYIHFAYSLDFSG